MTLTLIITGCILWPIGVVAGVVQACGHQRTTERDGR